MKASTRNIVIAGGGMVGISLALQLDALLPADISIALVESFALPSAESDAAQPSAYHPSFDARSTALSFSSRQVYQGIGVWARLAEHACAIETIHVSSKGRFGSTVMSAADYQWPALGYVVENAWLGRCLGAALANCARIEVISPARVITASSETEGTALIVEGEGGEQRLQADLLIIADGADSALCEQLGMSSQRKPYGQHALIANVAVAQPHAGCAYERFTDEGPLAMLPLVAAAGAQHRCALVWTLPPERSEQLLQCSAKEFAAQLQQRFGYRLGRIGQIGERFSYPLALSQSQEQVRQGVVVMGNAAHALHPVAGQGYNLALRDIAELGASLQLALQSNQALGELDVLQRYQERQRDDQNRTIDFSDRIPGLFMQRDPLLAAGRDLALAGLDFLPPLKEAFVRQAAGIAALGENRDG